VPAPPPKIIAKTLFTKCPSVLPVYRLRAMFASLAAFCAESIQPTLVVSTHDFTNRIVSYTVQSSKEGRVKVAPQFRSYS